MKEGQASAASKQDTSIANDARASMRVILICVFILMTAGWVMLLDTGLIHEGQANQGNFDKLLLKRGIVSLLGIFVLGIAYIIPPRLYRGLTVLVSILTIILLILVWTPLGNTERGSRRWIEFYGISFQPLEFAKIGLVWFMASYLTKLGHLNKAPLKHLIFPGIVISLIIGFVAIQPNLSGVFFLIGLTFIMAWIGGVNRRIALALFSGGIAAICGMLALHKDKIDRFIPMLKPLEDLRDSGYQVGMSLWAIVSGGLFGRGPGGSIAMYSIPDHANDFIFPVIIEEWGFIGGMLIICVFAALVFSGFKIAFLQRDRFRLMLGCGIISIIGLQAIINIGVTLGMFPTTGLPLPFVSTGGSNLMISLLEIGLLMNLGRTAGVVMERAAESPNIKLRKIEGSAPKVVDRVRQNIREQNYRAAVRTTNETRRSIAR